MNENLISRLNFEFIQKIYSTVAFRMIMLSLSYQALIHATFCLLLRLLCMDENELEKINELLLSIT